MAPVTALKEKNPDLKVFIHYIYFDGKVIKLLAINQLHLSICTNYLIKVDKYRELSTRTRNSLTYPIHSFEC